MKGYIRHTLKGLEYALIFAALYAIVSAAEGSCSAPITSNVFLFATSPFNPIENCALLVEGHPAFMELVVNFLLVAMLVFAAGFYFDRFEKLSGVRFFMLYVFASGIITTYIASASSWAYIAAYHGVNLHVATGTSILGFDMCLFLAVFMSIELFYMLSNKRGKRSISSSGRGSIALFAYAFMITVWVLGIAAYLHNGLIHIAGILALPVFFVLLIGLGRTSLPRLMKSIKSRSLGSGLHL